MIIQSIEYNTQKPILKNRLVRQALDMALDKKAIVRIQHGFAKNITTPLPLLQWGYNHSIQDAPYNPAKAEALLKKAGYPNGFTLKFFISLGVSPANDLIAQIVQRDWGKIGVKVQLKSYEHGEFFRRLDAGEHDAVFMGGVGTNGDPDDFMSPLTCNTHQFSRWCHKPFDVLVKKALQITDRKTRLKLYLQAQKIIKQEVPITPLLNKIVLHVMHRSVKGYTIPLLDPYRYTGVSIE